MGQKIVRAGNFFVTPEISNALFKLSGASIAVAAGVATVTLASHLLSTGNLTTFSGATGATGFNNATWGPITVLTSGTYTFPVPASLVTPGGTIVQEALYFPPAGEWLCLLGANGQLEYNPDNTYGSNPANSGLDLTWRAFLPASDGGYFRTDGISVRFRQNGTTATSVFSLLL
jgi:hypothetical protein